MGKIIRICQMLPQQKKLRKRGANDMPRVHTIDGAITKGP